MIRVQTIESLEHSQLAPYRTLRNTSEHERQGIFVAEGEKVVGRLMESGLEVVSVLITAEWLMAYEDRLKARPEQIAVFVGVKTLLNSIVGFHLHQGIMAVAKIPRPREVESLVHESKKPFLFVAVDGLTNSENLGVVVRNCVAFGVQALIVGETSSNPYLRRSVRNSMGTIFRLPVVNTTNLVSSLGELKSRFSMRVIAAHPRGDLTSFAAARLKDDCCLVFGSEGYGISREVLGVCDDAVAIPMNPGVDSLNVASASAVLLYEVVRQRS